MVVFSRRVVTGGAVGVATIASLALARWSAAERPETSYTAPADGRKTVAVRDFGAVGNGSADDTRAFQAAIRALPQGGTVVVDRGLYAIRSVDVVNRYVTIRLADDAVLKRIGPIGPAQRGLFMIALVGAHFALEGGTIDLNGEGPLEIGGAGRIANRYADQTVPGVRAIAGPSNAAIYGVRSSFISVSGVTIRNSGENGLLLRNCGNVRIDRCSFSNIANFGIEFSLVPAAHDGGTGEMPLRGACSVTRCSFEDIDDFGLGTGNGVGVGGGGAGKQGPFARYEISDCDFARCQRDIHFEFLDGSWIERLAIARIKSEDARQGSFGLVGVRDATITDYSVVDAGSAPTAALSGHYPSIYGGVLSGDFDRVALKGVSIVDRRHRGVVTGRSGRARAGARDFSARDANFTIADIGAFLGMRNGNPGGAWYVGRIVSVQSRTRVTIDPPVRADVSDAGYAYGGATREGLILTHGGRVTLENVRIEAGRGSCLPGEPPAAGLRIESIDPSFRAVATTIAPPPGPSGGSIGIRLLDAVPQLTATVRRITVR